MRPALRHVLAAAVLLLAAPKLAPAQQFVDVRQVAMDTLRDVATTVIVKGRPTIFYNPARMQSVGPKLSAFAMGHEWGHVRYGHAGALLADHGPINVLRIQQELEADCYAARILGETDPEAIQAAIQFFTTMGPFRYDALHPSGSQRSAKILSCLPTPEPAQETYR